MRVTDFIICDDIRHEMDNKISLMGIYGDSLLVKGDAAAPFNFLLGVYVRIEILPEDARPDAYLLVVALNNEPLGEVRSPIAIPADKQFVQFVVPFKPLPVPALGELSFTAELFREQRRIGDLHRHSISIRRQDG
jgi:hypothetical protein